DPPRLDLARVHEPVGVERTLDVYERLVEPVAEQSPVLVRTDEAVAVLAAPRAAVLEHQLEDLCAYVPVRVQAGFVLQVQERPDVDYANGGVCVHDDARAVALTDLHDLWDVEGQLVDGYRGVFDERRGLLAALDGGVNTEARAPQLEDLLLLRFHLRDERRVRERVDLRVRCQGRQLALQLVLRLTVELHQ